MEILRQHSDYPQVMKICKVLNDHGYKAWLAGGCVRDALLNRLPKDFDVVTDARPEQVEEFFSKTISIGKQFGIIVIVEGESQIEVATFRSDGAYVNGRHPTEVVFSDPSEDAARRDFTINSMFYDPKSHQLIDFVGGQSDLNNKCIRTVGEAQKRFSEDHLRILRAVRFSADLGFEIEANTLKAIKENAKAVLSVSKERQRDELRKLLNATFCVKGLQLMGSTGLFEAMTGQKYGPEQANLFQKIETQKFSLTSLWVMFFGFSLHPQEISNNLDTIRNNAIKHMTNYKFSNQEVSEVRLVIEGLKMLLGPTRLAQVLKLTIESYAISLKEIATLTNEIEPASVTHLELYTQTLEAGFQLPEKFITGKDMQSLGFIPGPEYGKILDEIYNLQIEEKITSKSDALNWIKNIKKT